MSAIPVEEARYNVHAISLPARTFTGDFWFTHDACRALLRAAGVLDIDRATASGSPSATWPAKGCRRRS